MDATFDGKFVINLGSTDLDTAVAKAKSEIWEYGFEECIITDHHTGEVLASLYED
jgi:hypothetical protein